MNFEDNYMDHDDDFMLQDYETEEFAGPNNGSSNYNYRGGFRRGGGMYGPPQFSGPRRPPGQGGPPFMWGRGFGPRGPPIQQHGYSRDKPIQFLMRCGIPRQQLKGLPRPLLCLMEPEFCGLCAQGFFNFTESSLHYISKNHIKNQKRWLAQQSKIGPNPVKELPLKSRELYCELCDVQMTSKNHADLHYAGKLHRSVVEGRKNPRNPILLQKGMENRLRQLIRREKKNLKSVRETVANEEDKKESKPVPPELYCDICKTSVTCTEQMTMHLNGKKHLSKEKQHILKMMKGDTAKDQGATDASAKDDQNDDGAQDDDDVAQIDDGVQDDEAQDVGAQDDVAQDNGAQDDGAKDDDWANGSGTWDDDPQ